MVRRKKKDAEPKTALDEREWEDWRALREELGKRLGGRGATGVSDADVLDAARKAARTRTNR